MKGSIAIQILPKVERDEVFGAVDRVIELYKIHWTYLSRRTI